MVVDDEPAIRSSLAAVLEDEVYPVRCCAHAQEFDALKEQPSHGATRYLASWRRCMATKSATNSPTAVIMMSGHAGIEAAVSAINWEPAIF